MEMQTLLPGSCSGSGSGSGTGTGTDTDQEALQAAVKTECWWKAWAQVRRPYWRQRGQGLDSGSSFTCCPISRLESQTVPS